LFTRRSGRRALATVASLLALSLVAAACGGDDGEEAATTTDAPTTTTTTEPPTTTTTTAPPVMQLTGLPVAEELAPARTAMIVKIDNNNSNARPQRGITTADVVIEEAVEGNESRFFAVFHSTYTDPVGPVRSARTSDIDLMPMFGRPTFSSSGGNGGTMGAIRDANVAVVAGHDSVYGSYFFRLSNDNGIRRRAPHNLFTNLTELCNAACAEGSPPPPFANWIREGEQRPATALPNGGADITFGNNPVRWSWDPNSNGYIRDQRGTAHVDAEGNRVTAQNVLLLMTPYGQSRFDHRSPEALSVGSGEAWVLSGGTVTHGTWSRPTREVPYALADDAGNPIALTPGQTWLELLRTDKPLPAFF
jgi:Protein of unknown function (DUF3048) N-terminal domain/Protein of unknown function (DUF3048) C-terminal domain